MGVCLPGLACANGVVNGSKSIPEKMLPSPPAEVLGLGVDRPETDVPHTGSNGLVSAKYNGSGSALKVLLKFPGYA